MDVKSMAKSKRSHTRHHQPRKPKNPSSSSPPYSSSSTSSLPSNWGRYEEDDLGVEVATAPPPVDSDSDDPSRLVATESKTTNDEVEPKSKGADFRYLIAQAKESQSRYAPSFDDTLPESYKGLGPMLAVRGESILSWDGADSFLGDDEGTATQEAPFLRLDLQAIAEQLEKIDLAKRLFIEADLLASEQRAPEAHESDNQESFKEPEKQKKAAVGETFEELLSLYLAAEEEAESQNVKGKAADASSSAATSSCEPELASATEVTDHALNKLGFPDAQESPLVGHTTPEDAKEMHLVSHTTEDAKETVLVSHTTEQDPQLPSGFGAGDAEAELDLLLNSFGETKFLDSPGPQPDVASFVKQHSSLLSQKGNSITHAASSHSQHPVGPSADAFSSNLDDDLDDLLEGTSKPNNNDGLFRSSQVQITAFDHPSSSSSSAHPSSKALDDFDSWFDTL